MAKSDAEISLKVNMPPPNEFKRALAQAQKLQRNMADSWAEIGHDLGEQTAQAKRVLDLVKGTKFEAGVKGKYAGIEHNIMEGESMIIGGKINKEGQRLGAVPGYVESGQWTEAEALGDVLATTKELAKENKRLVELGRQYDALSKANADTQAIYEVLEATRERIAEAEKLEVVMEAQRDEYLRLSEAERVYREGLDETSATYARDAAAAQRKEVYYKKAAAAQGAQVKVLHEQLAATREQMAQAEDSNAILAEGNRLVELGVKARERSVAVSDEVQLRHSVWIAEVEKEEEARAKAAQREQERMAEREAREAQMAKREAERAERERFNMELSLLSKDELIKKLKELQAAREAAALAGDNETYEKRTREFMAAREQMEKVNTQLNITRLAWTQQAQMANQFAGSLTDVAGRLGNVGDAAAKGELDLVGMANGMQQVGTQFASMLQAGMGPLGALTLILQMAQAAWNKVKKEELERMAQVKAFAEQQKALNELLRVNRVELEEFARVKLNKEAVEALVEKHRDLNAELEKEVSNIDKAAEAELYRMGLTADAEEHKMRMQQADLGRKLARGEITQEAYDEQMAGLQLAMDKKRLEQGTRRAQVEYDAAAEKEAERRAAYQVKAEEVAGLKRERRGMKWDREFLGTYEEGRARAQKLIDEATANYEKLREERGEDDGMTDDARIAMLDAINAAADYEQEAWKMVDEYFGAGHGMTLDEALKKYRDKLEAVDGKLEAAEQLRKEAETGLNEAVAERDRLGMALERAETAERVEKGRLDEAFESEAETRAVRKAEKDKADKRARQLEDLRNKADAMTEEELRAKLAAAREARKNAQDEHAREFAKAQVELYRGRLKGRRESERERIAAAGMENDLKGSAVARGAFAQLDLQGVMNTMDDGRLSKGEVRMLLRQLELARKAENAEALAMIRAIVEQALASKKMNAETKRQVKKAFEK